MAHEIGHSKHKHLFFFALVLLGMIFATSVTDFLEPYVPYPILFFMIYTLSVAVYFRIVFGFFSRLFERQADLYGIELGLPPAAMIEALHLIGVFTGNSHHIPNWHHFSIAERIAFLQAVEKNPALIQQHTRKVWLAEGLFVLSLIGFFYIYMTIYGT